MSVSGIETFRDRIVGRRVKESTADKYERWIGRFETWAEEATIQPGVGALIDFDSFLSDEGRSDYPWANATGRPVPETYSYSSRNIALSAVKLWMRLHYGEDIREEVQNIVSGEPADFDPHYLSKGDIEQVYAEADEACDATGCEAAIRLTYDAILRASELVMIDRGDIDLSEGTVYVEATKGSLNTTLGVSDETLMALEELMAQEDSTTLFKNSYGNGWNANSWAKHFRLKHHPAGAHSFGRHSPITHMLQDGEPFGDVFQRARHRNAQTTSRYARVVDVDVPDWAGGE